jgi:uncharacterized SAM-binding protein YcdF (DUF218 family)
MKKTEKILLAVAVPGLCWLAGLAWFGRSINAYVVDGSTRTDAIVVLTGGRNRIPEAVELLNGGMADRLFISGVQKDISLREISRRGDVRISTDREITLDNRSTNTIENAVEASSWIRENNIGSIRLVTSNYHIPRSLREFRAMNPELKIVVHPVYSENVSADYFGNWGTFSLIASEYNKFLYVYLFRN